MSSTFSRRIPYTPRAVALLLAVAVTAALGRTAPAERVAYADPVPAPILVIVNSAYAANPLGGYLGELLRAEGLNAYATVQLSALTAGELAAHRVAVLAETTLTSGQAALLSDYVNGGGRLIALRPDSQIKALFGLGASAGTQTDGYLKFEAGQAATQGLATSVLQLHGVADKYTLAGGTLVARLYTNKTTATAYPAVAQGSAGRAVAFTYDLVKNVVYTRQGNPALANRVDTLGTWDTANPPVTRTVHLFGSPNYAGGAPLWIDRDLIPVPQADEQMRLLARLILEQLSATGPMPQLWYFPGSAKTVLVPTGDAHANPGSAFTLEMQSLQAHAGRITLYMSIGAGVTESDLLAWEAQGHSFGIHPYAWRQDDYAPYNVTSLAQGYTAFDAWFAMAYPNVTESRTVRHHQVAWAGWTGGAELAAAHGMALDTNFYHWGPWLQKGDGTWPHGYLTGSGQPMKFVKADGTIVPVYQQLTQLVDEHLVGGTGGGWEALSAAEAAAVSQALIDASLAGDYAALMTQFHVDYYTGAAQDWAEATLDYAVSHGVPVLNADEWLEFTERRNAASYTNLAWNDASGTLTFNLNAGSGAQLTTLLPATYGGRSLQSVTVDGGAAGYTWQTIKGQSVAFVPVASGNHAFSAVYGPGGAPTATATFTATATRTPTATHTPTATRTATHTATATYTPTATRTATHTATATYTPTATRTATHTATATATFTATRTATATYTPTATRTATHTATYTPTATRTATHTPAATHTPTATATPTATVPIPNTGGHSVFIPVAARSSQP